MVDAAVVGLGRIGATFQDDPLRKGIFTHAAAWGAHPGSRLVAGIDPDKDKRHAFETCYGVPAYPSWEEMLAEHIPEMVSVCTPPDQHKGCVVDAYRSGALRIICEKPCTPSRDEAIDLLGIVGAGAARVGVNFTRRFDPVHRMLIRRVASESIVAAQGFYTGGLSNTASHWLASLLATGERAVAVLAVRGTRDAGSPTLLIRLEGGATVCLQGGSVADFMSFEATFVTPRSRIELRDGGTRAELWEASPSSRYSEYMELAPTNPPLAPAMSNPMLSVIDDAIASNYEGRPMSSGIDDAIDVHSIIEAANDSLSSGSWVQVPGRES